MSELNISNDNKEDIDIGNFSKHKNAYKWTEDKTLRLIRLFRSKPALWDPHHELHFKKTAKPALWNVIGEKLNMSPNKCKDKIVNLMSGFRREKAKLLRALGSFRGNWGEEMDYKVRFGWYALQELGFLIYKEVEKRRQESGQPIDANVEYENLKQALLENLAKRRKQSTYSSEDESQDVIEMKEETAAAITLCEQRTEWRIKPGSPSSSENQQESTYIHDDSSEPTPDPIPSSTTSHRTKRKRNNNNEEEISFFAKFIASKMKNYSETTKNSVQKEICEVIFKADQHYYETVVNDNNCSYVYDPLDDESTSISKKSKQK